MRVPDQWVLNGNNVGDRMTGLKTVKGGEKHRPALEAVVLDNGERGERGGCDELGGPWLCC